jgi:hypothetical protein
MTSSSTRLILASVLACAAACSAAPRQRPVKMGPTDTGPGSIESARKFLMGRWTLESFDLYPPGKPPINVKGSGTLLYDDYGNLKMDIRADQASADLVREAGIDIRDGIISSEGRAAIDMQNHTLTYIIPDQAPLIPGPLSINRKRYWEVTGNLLTLTTKDDDGKPTSVGKWRKAS